jgi:DNA anti-recombination protein RmuC
MALQQIYWEQIATEDITSGQTVNLGNPTASLKNVYADNFFINGTQSLNDLIGGGITEGIDPLNQFSASVLTSLEFTGSNMTVKGDLNVLGTYTSIKSETVTLDDNIIELNGTDKAFGGLLIKDPTNPNLVSGSLLWDTTTDRWVGGPLGSEENLVIESELTTLSSSISSSINELSQSVSSSFDQVNTDLTDLSSSVSSSINDLSQSVSSSFDQVNTDLTDLSSSLSSSINELSSSVDSTFTLHDGRLVDLESFSSSLDATFATDQQLTELSQSITSSIGELSSSLDGRVVNLEDFSSSLDATFATDQQLTDLSSSLSGSISELSSSLSSSINDLSQSVSSSFDQVNNDLTDLSSSLSSSINELSQSVDSTFTLHDGRLVELESTGSDHETRIDGLELFSTSLDNTYATDQELEDISASLSDAIGNAQTDIEASNIFQQTGSYYGTSENLQISGSGLDSPDGSISGKYGVIVSKSLHAENINVGQPTSNDWGTMNGSYFNNFNENTDVSEIIRFMAGLLSSSAPDASPNTKYYNGYTKNTFNTSTDSGINGYLPSGTTNSTLVELIDAGFASIGGTILGSFGTFYTNSNYRHSFTSKSGGSTSVRSSNDSNLFGLGRLSSGTPTTFKVSGSFTFKKFDHNRVLIEESSSNHLIQQSGAGTTNGVTLGKIESANPELIPAGYQDGKYSGVFNPTILNAGNTLDDIGYYHISSSISIASGSSDFTEPIESNTEILYGPIPTIESGIGSTNLGVTANIDSMTQLTATSRSLSGAPYLQTATFNASGSIGGTFNKLYQNGTHGSMSGNSGQRTASVSGGRISTSNVFYDETFTDLRSSGTIPFITDKIKLNSGLSWSAGNSYGTSANQSVSITGTGFGGSRSDSESRSVHIAGTFGQPASSGSLHYYGRSQTYDGSSNTSENFTGEGRRLELNDNLLSFGGTSWDNTYNEYGILGPKDLQVRPNRLVKPGGNNGYWLTNPSNSSDYKYYVRKFSTSGTKTSMSINVSGPSLVSWDSTNNNSASVAILFESSTTNVYTNARFYDPTKTLENFVGSINSNTDGTNPFGLDIDLYGNTGGSGSGGSYSLPMRNSDGMFLNSTYNEIMVLVRYKGDPTPITSLSVSFS